MMGLMLLKKLVPYVAVVAIVGGFAWYMYSLGADHKQLEWDAHTAQLEAAFAQETARLTALSSKWETRYNDEIIVVNKKRDALERVVPTFVSEADDARCDVSPGFVELHDAAVENRLPDTGPSREFNAGVTQPRLSDVGRTVVVNYGKFHAMRTQCVALQEWARELAIGGDSSK